jgi:hypothetical protein
MKEENNNHKAKSKEIEKDKDNKESSSSTTKPLFDQSRTIFLQNINFSASENDLFNFFKRFGAIIYAKICKVNNTSKGTGFIMFSKIEDCNSVLEMYEKSIISQGEINPFEFQGKFLKIYKAYDKNDSSQKPLKKEDRRNRENLLFGLYNHFNGDLNEMDKEKREYLMSVKKENFTKNPNYYTSKTRLTIRNFSKNINEEQIREIVLNITKKYAKEKEIDERKVKFIKQVKIIRDSMTNKSKGTCFVEAYSEDLAKYLILNLSNIKISNNNEKGIIIDYALEDNRKLYKMEMKKKKIQHENNIKKKEMRKKKLEQNEKGEERKEIIINEISDVNLLSELYVNSISRGKKQKLKKRLLTILNNNELEFEKAINNKRKEVFINKENYNEKNGSNEYRDEVIQSKNTELNKKAYKFRKEQNSKKKDGKSKFNSNEKDLLRKKRNKDI